MAIIPLKRRALRLLSFFLQYLPHCLKMAVIEQIAAYAMQDVGARQGLS